MSESRFAVVTDSTADIPSALAEELGISVVPLSVSFGADTFRDGELSQEQFFDRMRAMAPKLPTTSQPPVGSFVAAYEDLLTTAEEVVSIHISNRLSGTIDSARQAAEQFAGRVHVFDSANLSWGLGWQVVDAANAAAEGMSAAAALARLEGVRSRVKLIVGLDSLDNLARGGRIGRVSAFLGAMLNLKVTLEVDDGGAFAPLARSRGEAAALRHTMDWLALKMGDATSGKFAVGHALSRERAEKLADAIKERFNATQVILYDTGTTIATHTGTGWGVAVLPAE